MKTMIRCGAVLAALIALAVAAPAAMASGTYIAEVEGKALPVGSPVTFKSTTGFSFYTSKLGTIGCLSATLNGTVAANQSRTSGSPLLEIADAGSPSMSTCSNASGAEIQINNIHYSFASTGGGSAKSALSFEVRLPGGYTCKLNASPSWTWNPYETQTGASKLNFGGNATTNYQPACGSWQIHGGSFTASTKTKQPVFFN